MKSGLARVIRRIIRPFGVDLVRYKNPLVIAPNSNAGHPPETQSSVLCKLRAAYPIGTVDPDVRPLLLSDDGGGKELVEELIEQRDCKLILEIGTFFGASALRWASFRRELCVVCVDPWPDGSTGREAAKRGFPEFRQQLDQADGFYRTFIRNISDYHERIIPIRARSPEVLPRLMLLGLEPDLIYIDAGKVRDDLVVCHRLWPRALLTGDDWSWSADGGYPMRKVVMEFANENNLKVKAQLETWCLIS